VCRRNFALNQGRLRPLDSETAVFPLRILVPGMVLFKESLAQWSPARKAKAEHSSSECLTYLLLSFLIDAPSALPQDFVETAVTFLVTRFMPLNPNDLEGWMANPEEWVNTEDKDDEQWQFEIRVRSYCRSSLHFSDFW